MRQQSNMHSNRALVRVVDINPTETALTYSTGVHYNALHLSPNEEYELFRRKNRVAESYRGPVYVAEDIQVPCAECGCPVDPITRVPVSDCTSRRIYFHPECIQCAICKCNDFTLNYFMVYDTHRNREPIVACARCVYNGYVSLDEPIRKNKRGVCNKTDRNHYINKSSINNNSSSSNSNTKMMYSKTGRHINKGTNSINLPCLPGCTPASLSIKGNVHSTQNTTPRAIALIHRQQYYTQNDCNLLMRPPITEENNERINQDEHNCKNDSEDYNEADDKYSSTHHHHLHDDQRHRSNSKSRNSQYNNRRLKQCDEPSAARLHNERSMTSSETVHTRRSTLPKIEQQEEQYYSQNSTVNIYFPFYW